MAGMCPRRGIRVPDSERTTALRQLFRRDGRRVVAVGRPWLPDEATWRSRPVVDDRARLLYGTWLGPGEAVKRGWQSSRDHQFSKRNPRSRLREVKRQVKCANEQQSAPPKGWMQTTMPKGVESDTDYDEQIQSNHDA